MNVIETVAEIERLEAKATCGDEVLWELCQVANRPGQRSCRTLYVCDA